MTHEQLAALGGLAIAGTAMAGLALAPAAAGPLVWYDLRWPRDIDPEGVVGLLRAQQNHDAGVEHSETMGHRSALTAVVENFVEPIRGSHGRA